MKDIDKLVKDIVSIGFKNVTDDRLIRMEDAFHKENCTCYFFEKEESGMKNCLILRVNGKFITFNGRISKKVNSFNYGFSYDMTALVGYVHYDLVKRLQEMMESATNSMKESKTNPYSGVSFEYNGHTWGMCARDNGVEILVDGKVRTSVPEQDDYLKDVCIIKREVKKQMPPQKTCDKIEDLQTAISNILKVYAHVLLERSLTREELNNIDAYAILNTGKLLDYFILDDRAEPAEWSKEDEDNFKHLMDEIVCLGNSRNSANRLHYDRLIKFLYELKNRAQPREEWRDKDERMLDRLIAYFEKRVAFTDDDNPRYANWLKSLRPQNHWKPSEEQMKVLDVAIMNSHLTTAEYDGLVKLREQLKKL